MTFGGNSYPGARVTTDIGQAVNENWAFRFNAMYENTQSYRDFVSLDRWAINPTATFAPNDTTTVKLSYEHLHDHRTVDRGIPSQNPARAACSRNIPTEPRRRRSSATPTSTTRWPMWISPTP